MKTPASVLLERHAGNARTAGRHERQAAFVPLLLLLLLWTAVLSGCGGGGSAPPPVAVPPTVIAPPPAPPPPPAAPAPPGSGPSQCEDGSAGDFACSGISLAGRVSLADMEGKAGNDIWGWTDEETGGEYALMGMSNGVAFVDVTDPESPTFLGRLPTETRESLWRDIKVYGDHAYVVADDAGAHGMQVFDLTRLRGLRESSGDFSADAVYGDFGHAHNLAINEATGYAYAVSTDTCTGGLHMVNIRTPINPMFAGCHHPENRTHDTHCVVYRGPDAEHRGREICVSSNEDHVEVVDVTDKSAPLTLSTLTYPNMRYVHQGWLTEDHAFFLLGDELDESDLGLSTRTHVFDVSDLDAPDHLYAHDLGTDATDHNLYVLGDRVFEANYTSGLRVLEFGDLAMAEMEEIGWFDTFPKNDGLALDGAWSVYPYLPSGTIIVSDITNGLFVLTLD